MRILCAPHVSCGGAILSLLSIHDKLYALHVRRCKKLLKARVWPNKESGKQWDEDVRKHIHIRGLNYSLCALTFKLTSLL